MLEEHLDHGRPTVEQADDIRTIAKELAKLAVPKTGVKALIERLKTIRQSRTVWCWAELEDEMDVALRRIISRYQHTHPRPGIPRSIRSKLRPASSLPPPAHRN